MDPGLVARAQHGDRGAFEALTLASHPRLFRVAYGILRDRTLAEDATQQALIDVWRYLRRLRDPARFEPWAYRLVVNACRDELRRTRRDVRASEPDGLCDMAGEDPYGTLIDRDQLRRGFCRISVDHRTVIVLRYLLDLSAEDTAEALGVPSGTVASRLSRALSALRSALEADARGRESDGLGHEAAR